jgi:hypothetical protein
MNEIAVTRWFSIDDDGQPTLPGWYECLYACDRDANNSTMNYWDGHAWVVDEKTPTRLTFGNEVTWQERWRGLAEDPNAASQEAAEHQGGE